MSYLIGYLIGIGMVALLWIALWDQGKKRKIGLTITSYLAFFLTPIIVFVVICTKKTDKTQKYPTYKQRLPYENTTAMLIAAILYIVFSVIMLISGIYALESSLSGFAAIANSAIFFTWGRALIFERKKLIEAKSDSVEYNPFFTFDSNVQSRIDNNDNQSTVAHSLRKIVVESDGGDRYSVEIIDSENHEVKMNKVQMHKVSYSDIDECLSMVSDEGDNEYALNVFYKDGQVEKCVVCRKSKGVFIHYYNE